jgi:hypothetical protein
MHGILTCALRIGEGTLLAYLNRPHERWAICKLLAHVKMFFQSRVANRNVVHVVRTEVHLRNDKTYTPRTLGKPTL